MQSTFYKVISAHILVLILALGGCGGGGGGGSGGGEVDKGIAGVSLGGSAVKGIIKNGKVIAEELDTSGTVVREVGTATTAADGSYSLNISNAYTGGPIQITISADVSTEMKCDIPAGCGARDDGIPDSSNPSTIDFGEWYKPGSLSMTALIAAAEKNASISANVTPYTDLATRRAKEAASLTAAVVNQANSEVSNLLGGIDIMNTKPLDITDPVAVNAGNATEIAYAAFSAAIAALADTSSGKPDMNSALSALGTSFTGGTISVVSLQQIITGAQSAFAQAGIVDTSGATASMQVKVDGATGGVVDPEPSPSAGDSNLAKVKAFVSDVRTWGTVISTELDAEANAFSDQANLASTAANASGGLLTGRALNSAVQAIGGFFDGTYTSNDLSAAEYSGLGFISGSISSTGDTFVITDGVVDGVTVNMTGLIPQDGTTATSFTIGITIATFRSAAADADINSGIFTLTTASGYTIDWAAIDAGTADPEISSGSIDFDLSLTQKQDELGAPLAAIITFTGKLSATLVNPKKDSTGDYVWVTPKTLTLSGGVSSSAGHSLDFSLTANVTNADAFTPIGSSLDVGHIKTGIITWATSDSDSDTMDDTYIFTSPDLNFTVIWDSVSGSADITEEWAYGYTNHYTVVGPYASLSNALNANNTVIVNLMSNYYYAGGYIWIDGEGGYTVDILSINTDPDGSLDGTLVDPDFVIEGTGAGEWLDANVGLTFNLQLSDLPKASVTISADRTDYQSGTASITIAYDVRKIVLSGAFTDSASTGGVEVTNQDGVVMNIAGVDFDTGTGSIMYNGNTYATITTISGDIPKISYIDGTFETW